MLNSCKNIKQSSILKNMFKKSYMPVVTLLVIFFVMNIFITKGFLTSGFMVGFFSANAPLILISIGVAVVIIGGGIDISLGAMACLINVVFITLVGKGYSFGLSATITIVMGLICGTLNGVVVGFLRVPPLLATFAST
jgi:ribose transport system permease protein